MEPTPRILIADDEAQIRALLETWLQQEGWVVETASDGKSALSKLESATFDVAVLDLRMPNLTGVEVLELSRRSGVETDILILTGYGTVESAVEAMKHGAKDYIQKPFRREAVVDRVRQLIEFRYPQGDPLGARIHRFLRSHYDEASLTVNDVATAFGISTRYVSKMLNNEANMSFQKLLTHYRLERAKLLITSSGDPFYKIADGCGFRNYRQMSEAFRRTEGMSPRRYREINMSR
jgi:YesN/AraC family two-component response regulator